eukprot:Skav213593  [mRNA]  locus=scaffold77:33241:46001:- [translate_table: standard]
MTRNAVHSRAYKSALLKHSKSMSIEKAKDLARRDAQVALKKAGFKIKEQERQVVHETAMHLGLTAHTEGGRTTRHVTVANLKTFVASARARMAAIIDPESSELFESLNAMQMVAVESAAGELGLHAVRRSSGAVLVSMHEPPPLEERRPSLASNEESSSQPRCSKEKAGTAGGFTTMATASPRPPQVIRAASKDEDFGDVDPVILSRETSQAPRAQRTPPVDEIQNPRFMWERSWWIIGDHKQR